MRKLKASDLFAALRVVAAIEEKDSFSEIVKNIVKQAEKKETDAKKGMKVDPETARDDFAVRVGVDAIFKVVELASGSRAEARIYEFLAGPFELTPEEVKDMEAPAFISAISEMAKENDLSDFFKSALELRQNM